MVERQELFSVHKFSYKFRFLDDDGEKADSFEEAINIVNRNKYGNGASIFTTFGVAARKFQTEIEAGQRSQTCKSGSYTLKMTLEDGTSRIQLRKEMNMILTPPLTTEIKEDDASQLYYMLLEIKTSEDRERMFDECLGMRSWILNCQGKSQKKLINLVASECLKL
ncbi:hypothetical protein CMV_026152 [Castanea mollissima]|uniref:Aldehyde dehydrogenase domain-containing protein n=1 Tax=Castanea mollissima TaxID=60419 RepID=A0A8J4V472_9ROSI|nr:hypothetical protein CMV_026152 [Castanea mollissima]